VTPRGAALLLDVSWVAHDLVGRHLPPGDPAGIEPSRPPAYVTAVFRAPPDHAQALAGLVAGFAALDPGQHFYPVETIHVTLAPVLDAGADPAAVSAALGATARRLADPPLSIRIVGLAMTRGSLVALGLPSDERLARERAALRSVLGRPARSWHGLLRSDGLVHLTIARWRHRPVPTLVAAIRAQRRLRLPPRPLDAIELVRTNKVMATESTVVLRRFPLVA
jgi:2'-5' RNA ligase